MDVTGFVDLHSHLLPGIDDGCRSLDESLACVRTLMANRFRGTVCTPHMGLDFFPENNPATTAAAVSALQDQLREAGLEYPLWAGGELRIAEDTLPWLADHGVPTLGPSRAVLVDYWGSHWPHYADRVVEHLIDENFQPILAHPERMDFDDREWEAVLSRLEQSGVWLQGNLRCVAGREGERVGRRAQNLLGDDRYRLLATDMHGTSDLGDRLAGLGVAEQLVGTERVQTLLADGPQEIVNYQRNGESRR